MKIRPIGMSTLHGVVHNYRIEESKNVFLVGREIIAQYLNKKFFVGFYKAVPFNSWDEFARSLNEEIIETENQIFTNKINL